MAGKVKGRRLTEHGVPAAPQLVAAEITQTRNLGIDLLAVQRRGARPGSSGGSIVFRKSAGLVRTPRAGQHGWDICVAEIEKVLARVVEQRKQ